ncbi:unnamed protein product, partial [Ectocarpus sp. 12 AP-2014]
DLLRARPRSDAADHAGLPSGSRRHVGGHREGLRPTPPPGQVPPAQQPAAWDRRTPDAQLGSSSSSSSGLTPAAPCATTIPSGTAGMAWATSSRDGAGFLSGLEQLA